MKSYKTIDQHFRGYFQIVDYHVSHCQLLLRASQVVDDVNHNLDLRFEGVAYMELAANLDDLHILNGGAEDWEYIKGRYNREIFNKPPHDFQTLFKIISGGKIYYVLAALLWINTNTLMPFKSSIATPRE